MHTAKMMIMACLASAILFAPPAYAQCDNGPAAINVQFTMSPVKYDFDKNGPQISYIFERGKQNRNESLVEIDDLVTGKTKTLTPIHRAEMHNGIVVGLYATDTKFRTLVTFWEEPYSEGNKCVQPIVYTFVVHVDHTIYVTNTAKASFREKCFDSILEHEKVHYRNYLKILKKHQKIARKELNALAKGLFPGESMKPVPKAKIEAFKLEVLKRFKQKTNEIITAMKAEKVATKEAFHHSPAGRFSEHCDSVAKDDINKMDRSKLFTRE